MLRSWNASHHEQCRRRRPSTTSVLYTACLSELNQIAPRKEPVVAAPLHVLMWLLANEMVAVACFAIISSNRCCRGWRGCRWRSRHA